MSTTQIPPTNPAPSSRPPEGGDLYDARYWESAYREIVEAPALLLQLQDELSQARRREAFWISVVVHLIVVLLLYNSPKLAGFLPRRAVIVASPQSNQKDLTYLELPPDEQKVAKRPDTNIISDKDRIATSHAPQIDRKELKKILDASRPGQAGCDCSANGATAACFAGGQSESDASTISATTSATSTTGCETANSYADSSSGIWQRDSVRRFGN